MVIALSAVTLTERTARPGILAEAEVLTTRVHAETVEELMLRHSLKPADIAVVGFVTEAARLTMNLGFCDVRREGQLGVEFYASLLVVPVHEGVGRRLQTRQLMDQRGIDTRQHHVLAEIR